MSGYNNNEDDEEMVGLLSRTDHDSSVKRKKKKSRSSRKSLVKPLEVMHSSTNLRLLSEKSSTVACQTGFMMSVLSVMIGLWVWSGHQVDTNTSVQRWHSLKLRDIKHWCLDKLEDCVCDNPLDPRDRIGYKTWQEAHDGNIRDAVSGRSVDVVLLGDSITEGWRGMSFGNPVPHKQPNIRVYDSLFDKQRGADLNGLALGIAGDRTPHLLWRIQNGEVPVELQPSVWWILIGTNDFGKEDPFCSPEVVSMGIKRVVEELRRLRPGSTIVVNSLLPRSEADLNGRLIDTKKSDRVTVWQGIMEVNRALRDYCKKLRNVVYFDATGVFVEQDEGSKGLDGMYIPKELMYDFLHPTADGYKKWGTEIVKKVHELMDASQADKGRKILPPWDRNSPQQTKNKEREKGK